MADRVTAHLMTESDLARTPGISKKLAAVIYESLHSE